ncbi:MAG: restriction endonuclease [Actinomycetota bacterium]
MAHEVPKRISPNAYQALREALPVVFHYKRPYESYLRAALRDHPELLAGLNFTDVKRRVADELVERLASNENRYQETTVDLMMSVASMARFPDLEKHEDAEFKLAEARSAVEELRRWTEPYLKQLTDQEEAASRQQMERQQHAAIRAFADDLGGLRDQFLELNSLEDAQERGQRFEKFVASLFELFDLEPRLAYSLSTEQIDGSVTFDTDDYIVEARWRKEAVQRGDADVFAAKVRRKGKNALGMFISVNGFSAGALKEYSESTPFIAIDGADLMAVLEHRIRLDDLLRRKKRHANETGSCFLPVSRIAVDP